MFDFPIHKTAVISRASSRESDGTNISKNTDDKRAMRSMRSKIGDSPLTSKEFALNKAISQDRRESSNTFADNYRNGLKPSERMKKFNTSQPPLINGGTAHHSMIEDYTSGAPNVSHNLRLLKNKMRVNSASSEGADPYSNMEIPQKQLFADNGLRNSSNSIVVSKTNDTTAPLVNKVDSVYSSSSRKQKPVKADHQVLGPAKRFTMAKARQDSDNISVFTPKKSASVPISNPYETSTGKSLMKSTQRSAAGEDETKYLTSEEIEKLNDPKGTMAHLLTDLASKDWETQVNACNALRSIAIHDKNLIGVDFIRSIVADLVKIASSLRSSVCKNGLLALQDLFQN